MFNCKHSSKICMLQLNKLKYKKLIAWNLPNNTQINNKLIKTIANDYRE